MNRCCVVCPPPCHLQPALASVSVLYRVADGDRAALEAFTAAALGISASSAAVKDSSGGVSATRPEYVVSLFAFTPHGGVSRTSADVNVDQLTVGCVRLCAVA